MIFLLMLDDYIERWPLATVCDGDYIFRREQNYSFFLPGLRTNFRLSIACKGFGSNFPSDKDERICRPKIYRGNYALLHPRAKGHFPRARFILTTKVQNERQNGQLR